VIYTGTIDAYVFLKNLEKASKELDGEHQVSFDVLFATPFMRKHTNFSTFDEFLNDGNFVVNSEEDFENIPDVDMDNIITLTTNRDSIIKPLILSLFLFNFFLIYFINNISCKLYLLYIVE
jgi:hypothetical protein